MLKLKNRSLYFLMSLSILPQTCSALPLLVSPHEGVPFEISIDPSARFGDVIQSLREFYQAETFSSPISLTLTLAQDRMAVKKNNGRDYWASLTKSEKKDLHYIIKSLAYESHLSLGTKRSSILNAGDRIDHLHPLRFLLTIFKDEELKVGMHAIRDRSFIWSEFIDQFIEKANEEYKQDNMKRECILDFSKKLNIDPDLIIRSIEHAKWKDLINTLIDKIPRATDPNRYDM